MKIMRNPAVCTLLMTTLQSQASDDLVILLTVLPYSPKNTFVGMISPQIFLLEKFCPMPSGQKHFCPNDITQKFFTQNELFQITGRNLKNNFKTSK